MQVNIQQEPNVCEANLRQAGAMTPGYEAPGYEAPGIERIVTFEDLGREVMLGIVNISGNPE